MSREAQRFVQGHSVEEVSLELVLLISRLSYSH
jgi:hypothetical protein